MREGCTMDLIWWGAQDAVRIDTMSCLNHKFELRLLVEALLVALHSGTWRRRAQS